MVASREVRAGLQVAGQRVELTDRPLEVFLADLVVGLGHWSPNLGHRAWLPSLLHQPLRVARRTRRARRALRAAGGVALVSRNLSAWTYSSDDGLVRISAVRSDSRNSPGPSKSRILTRTEPSPCATWESEPA